MRGRFKHRLSVTLFLIVLTIVVITAFQTYWLVKNYREEKGLFTTRTNMLFRETVFRLQAAKLKMDTNVNIRVQDREGMLSISDVLQEKISDSEYVKPKVHSAMVVTMNNAGHPPDKDSLNVRYRITRGEAPGKKVFDFLVGVDSLRDSIGIPEITDRYRKALEKEKINVPFTIKAFPVDTSVREPDVFQHDLESNTVTLGFVKPVAYHLSFAGNTWYLLKRIGQPILISFFLLGVTVFSFVLLYRNLIRQQRLTQFKNDFISNITHELKTPIATVSVAIEALKNFNALEDPKKTSEYLDISANELQRLSLLVDKVLKLSMFENKEIALNKEPFHLVELARDVIASMRLQFEKQHATVHLEQTGNNFIITADKLHLTSVLYNLLDNALKYSRDNPHITVHIIDHIRFLEMRVEDNGIGIAREYKHKIFEQFFRVPGGNRHNIKGYGLGLSYVSHIVQRHMGYIEVESEVDKGSVFSVKLPFEEAPVIYYDRGAIRVKKISSRKQNGA